MLICVHVFYKHTVVEYCDMELCSLELVCRFWVLYKILKSVCDVYILFGGLMHII
jgi:hypothetical protein